MTDGQDGKGTHGPGRDKAGVAGLAGGILTGLASQAAVLTAVLFYFGWARARATYAYFGIDDLGVFNFSVTDFVLRSVSTALPMLLGIGILAAAAFALHGMASERLKDDKEGKLRTRAVRALTLASVSLGVSGFALALLLTGTGGSQPAGPALLMTGLVLGGYALILRTHAGSGLTLLMWAMAFLALLWSATGYADYIGTQEAQQIQAGLSRSANVTVYSATDLSLAGSGITESRISVPGGQYRFRYSGLRLLVSSGGQDFLLPRDWRPGAGAVIVLPATSGATRIEFDAQAP